MNRNRTVCGLLVLWWEAALLFGTAAGLPSASPAYAQDGEGAGAGAAERASNPTHLTPLGGRLFFVADDGVHGRELWCWAESRPGSGKCMLAADLCEGPADSNPDHLTPAGPDLYFTAKTPEMGREVWVWKQETSQVQLAADIAAGPPSSNPISLGAKGGQCFFRTDFSPDGQRLWLIGFPAGQAKNALAFAPLAGMGGLQGAAGLSHRETLLFCAGSELWESDGTPEGTKPIAELPGGVPLLGDFCVLGEHTFFCAQDEEHGRELWLTDCTRAGTGLVKDIRPGPLSSGVAAPCRHGPLVFFCADDGVHGGELWRTDGTPEGTVLVKDIAPGNLASEPHYMASAGSLLYFAADDGVRGRELWCSDGTGAGTRLVRDLTPGIQGTSLWSLTAFQEMLFFCASTPGDGEEIWFSDGTQDGTRILDDIIPGADTRGPNSLTALGDRLFFIYDEPRHGEELWMTDGTPAGTVLAADIRRRRHNPSSSPVHLTSLGDRLYFAGRDREHGQEVWTSDGSAEGTHVVCDAAPGTTDSRPAWLTAGTGQTTPGACLFFTAENDECGRELWCCSAGRDTAWLVSDIRPGPAGSSPEMLCFAGDALYFVADDGVHGRELWRSDGSPEGTALVTDAAPGKEGSSIHGVCNFESRCWFYTTDVNGAVGLWLCVEGGNNARRIATLPELAAGIEPTQLGEALANVRFDPLHGVSREDIFILLLLNPPLREHTRQSLVAADGVVYFVAQADAYGAELWRTQGTSGTTHLVGDAYPGVASSAPSSFLTVNGSLFFIAEHPAAGRVLWQSDGTSLGTHCVRPWGGGAQRWPEINAREIAPLGNALIVSAPRPIGGDPELDELGILRATPDGITFDVLCSVRAPRQLTSTAAMVFFTAQDSVHGEELWVTDGTREGTHMVKDLLGFAELSPLGG